MWINVLIVVAVLCAVFCLVVALRPAEFHVAQNVVIAAEPAVVFAKVNNLRTWQEFSPWAKMDPNARTTFTGPEAGEGASFAWVGNRQVGEGVMTIIESRSAERVRFRLEFRKPFKGENEAKFTFTPSGNQTEVTWSIMGKNNFLFKAVGLFIDCDKMIGPQFEQGLAKLKAMSETKN